MDDIQKIYKMLEWKNSNETQAEGIRLARQINDLSLLIMPPAPPFVWERCAEVLSEKNDMELETYLDSLLEWIRDLNWPGALIIQDRLKHFSGEKLKKPFINCFIYANSRDKAEAPMWIVNLSELLENEELKAELPQSIVEQLQKHYKKWEDSWRKKTVDGSVC